MTGRRDAPVQIEVVGPSDLDRLLGETAALFHRLRFVAEELHHDGENTAGRRGLLRDLAQRGPQMVPQMARARPVSRQYIQSLVNRLEKDGFVELIDNPAHRRSRLVRLTRAGKRYVEAVARREARAMQRARLPATRAELRAAADTLRRVREFFESAAWKSRG